MSMRCTPEIIKKSKKVNEDDFMLLCGNIYDLKNLLEKQVEEISSTTNEDDFSSVI